MSSDELKSFNSEMHRMQTEKSLKMKLSLGLPHDAYLKGKVGYCFVCEKIVLRKQAKYLSGIPFTKENLLCYSCFKEIDCI